MKRGEFGIPDNNQIRDMLDLCLSRISKDDEAAPIAPGLLGKPKSEQRCEQLMREDADENIQRMAKFVLKFKQLKELKANAEKQINEAKMKQRLEAKAGEEEESKTK